MKHVVWAGLSLALMACSDDGGSPAPHDGGVQSGGSEGGVASPGTGGAPFVTDATVGPNETGAIVPPPDAMTKADTGLGADASREDASSSSTSTPDAGADASGKIDGAVCLEPGGDCTDDPSACCGDGTCVYDTGNAGVSFCAANCKQNIQCVSNCCTPLSQGTGSVCAPAEYCAAVCLAAGGSCSGASDTCCPDSACIHDPVDDSVVCHAKCNANTDCNSGCCAPVQGVGMVCAAPQHCM